jgi:hypothetical protein
MFYHPCIHYSLFVSLLFFLFCFSFPSYKILIHMKFYRYATFKHVFGLLRQQTAASQDL